MVWLRRIDRRGLSGIPDESFVSATVSAGCGDCIRAFVHAGAARLFCKSVFVVFPIQPEHAFVFVVAHEQAPNREVAGVRFQDKKIPRLNYLPVDTTKVW